MQIALYQPDIPKTPAPSCASARVCHCLWTSSIHAASRCHASLKQRRHGLPRTCRHDATRWISRVSWMKRAIPKAPCRATHDRQGQPAPPLFAFRQDDTLLLGRESAGVPGEVHEAVDASVTIPMSPGMRSLNIAMAAAIVTGEALRQTGMFPSP
ncbi:MAG: TrmH family RNA methyltransferase [Tepidamorphaceae bacterium]